jgi:hypothetical protein
MTMDEPIENTYFNWLCAKIIYNTHPTPSLTFWNLFTILHKTEFVWLLSGDDNRAEDGLELREEFILETNVPDDPEWRVGTVVGCSMFEMLIAFSRRAEFMTDISYLSWFWEFLENLGLKELNDGADISHEGVTEVLDRFIWRTYDVNGRGGMLPLDRPKHDQREIQIWYQFCEYLVDQDRLV